MIKMTGKTGLLASTLALGLMGLTSAANAVPFSGTAQYLGAACPGGACVDLANSGYTVTGGDVINPSQNFSGQAKIPGTDTGNQSGVLSYNVTSSISQPLGNANTPIEVTNLDGAFSLYWGSIDAYNFIDFMGVSGTETFSGTDAVNLIDPNLTPSNFNTDGYFRFLGDFTSVILRSENNRDGSGIAFEVAQVAVPEPGTLALLGLGIAGLGISRRRKQA